MISNDIKLGMQDNKSYLKSLFEASSIEKVKQILRASSQDQANILLQVLFCLTHGRIPIKKLEFETIKKSRKHLLLHKFFHNNEEYEKLLHLSLKRKINVLFKFAVIYKNLLFTILVK
jgi:hypothetical protein